MGKILCNHCEKFVPASPRHKNQRYCNKLACQKGRKAAWQRKKISNDSEYRLNQKECNENWSQANPGYWKAYRDKNPKKVERNRLLQGIRNRCRTLKNSGVVNMDESLIAKMDPSILPENKALGQFWLVLFIAKMDALKVNIYKLSNTYE